MKASISAVAEIGLAVVVIALAALLVLPSSPRPLGALPAPPKAAAGAAGAAGPAAQPAATGKPVAVAEAAALFGYRAAAPAPRGVKTASAGPAAPIPSTGLTYLGSVTLADGKPSWMFKDLQANAVLTLQVGSTSGGWKLLQANDRSFLLESGGKRYSVTF